MFNNAPQQVQMEQAAQDQSFYIDRHSPYEIIDKNHKKNVRIICSNLDACRKAPSLSFVRLPSNEKEPQFLIAYPTIGQGKSMNLKDIDLNSMETLTSIEGIENSQVRFKADNSLNLTDLANINITTAALKNLNSNEGLEQIPSILKFWNTEVKILDGLFTTYKEILDHSKKPVETDEEQVRKVVKGSKDFENKKEKKYKIILSIVKGFGIDVRELKFLELPSRDGEKVYLAYPRLDKLIMGQRYSSKNLTFQLKNMADNCINYLSNSDNEGMFIDLSSIEGQKISEALEMQIKKDIMSSDGRNILPYDKFWRSTIEFRFKGRDSYKNFLINDILSSAFFDIPKEEVLARYGNLDRKFDFVIKSSSIFNDNWKSIINSNYNFMPTKSLEEFDPEDTSLERFKFYLIGGITKENFKDMRILKVDDETYILYPSILKFSWLNIGKVIKIIRDVSEYKRAPSIRIMHRDGEIYQEVLKHYISAQRLDEFMDNTFEIDNQPFKYSFLISKYYDENLDLAKTSNRNVVINGKIQEPSEIPSTEGDMQVLEKIFKDEFAYYKLKDFLKDGNLYLCSNKFSAPFKKLSEYQAKMKREAEEKHQQQKRQQEQRPAQQPIPQERQQPPQMQAGYIRPVPWLQLPMIGQQVILPGQVIQIMALPPMMAQQQQGQFGQPMQLAQQQQGQFGQPVQLVQQPQGQLGQPVQLVQQPQGQPGQPMQQAQQPQGQQRQVVRPIQQYLGQLGQMARPAQQQQGQFGQPVQPLGPLPGQNMIMFPPMQQAQQPLPGNPVQLVQQPQGQPGQPVQPAQQQQGQQQGQQHNQ